MITKENDDLRDASQWTNGGDEVLILKCVEANGGSYGGFKWPLIVGAHVVAEDWNPEPTCGAGLHGWPWGLSIGDGKEPDWAGTWLVFGAKPSEVVSLVGKVKAKQGTVRFVGNWESAINFVLNGQIALIQRIAKGAASATGYSGVASATGIRGAASATGYKGAASATGYKGAASATGYSGVASATGYSGVASATGYSGAASATGYSGVASATGYKGAASATGYSGVASATGNNGVASATNNSGAASATGYSGVATVTGLCGKVQGGAYGCLALAWWNEEHSRTEMRCAEIGCGDGSDGKLKSSVWYKLDEQGSFVEV